MAKNNSDLNFSFEVSIEENNVDLINDEVKDSVEKALTAVGLDAVGYAALLCPVDTGRLRNSIVYATHGSGGSQGGNGYPGEQATGEDMQAHGSPEESTVVIGTNVEYAQEIELGKSKQAPNGFLGPAIQNHLNEYKQILEANLGKE